MRKLHFPVPLFGHLALETWPAYMSDGMYMHAVLATIAACDFRVARHPRGFRDDRFGRFLVGESRCSRKCALNLDDPRGVIYLLQDNDDDWDGDTHTPPATKAVQAITVGELTRDKYLSVHKHLELETHGNYRLAHPSEIPAMSEASLN